MGLEDLIPLAQKKQLTLANVKQDYLFLMVSELLKLENPIAHSEIMQNYSETKMKVIAQFDAMEQDDSGMMDKAKKFLGVDVDDKQE